MYTSNVVQINRQTFKVFLTRNYCFDLADWARSLSSWALSSGESWAPKSAASNTGRISTSVPPSNGARLSHSTASSIDFTCQSQYQAMRSLVSAKGPSITVRFGPENRTRLPLEVD